MEQSLRAKQWNFFRNKQNTLFEHVMIKEKSGKCKGRRRARETLNSLAWRNICTGYFWLYTGLWLLTDMITMSHGMEYKKKSALCLMPVSTFILVDHHQEPYAPSLFKMPNLSNVCVHFHAGCFFLQATTSPITV